MIFYGKQVCLHLFDRHPELVRKVLLAKELEKKLFSRIKRAGCAVERVDTKKAQALARGGNHQGLLCETDAIEAVSLDRIKQGRFLVLLEGVTDMGNIGAIVRTAYALGVEGLIVTGIERLKMEPVARASSGALFDLPVAVCRNVLDAVNELKLEGFTLVAAAADGEAIQNFHVGGKRVLMLGSEEKGLGQKVVNKAHAVVSVPMANAFDSLNVAAAAAILIYEMRHDA